MTIRASERTAVWTWGDCIPISIDVIVERQLLVLLDGAVREDAHADVVANSPFRDIAIRIAAVISKSTDAPALSGINELRNKQGSLRELPMNEW